MVEVSTAMLIFMALSVLGAVAAFFIMTAEDGE